MRINIKQSFSFCRSLVTRLEPASYMSRILMMTVMKSWRLILSSSRVCVNIILYLVIFISNTWLITYWLQRFLQHFRKWSTPTVWWIPSGVCQHSNMWHRSLLLGQKDLYRHLQRWYHFSFFCRKGIVFVVTLPSNPANCHPRTHSLALLLRHHLYHSRQLLRHG